MYDYKLNRLEKNTVEILVDIPKNTVEKEYAASFSILLLNLEVEGFRKGKVPAKIAEKHLKKETVYQELIRSLVPRIYQEIIKKEGLKPIVSAKIELLSAKENEDWQIKITIAEKPIIQLGKYKEAIKKIKSEQQKEDIWIPGKQNQKGSKV